MKPTNDALVMQFTYNELCDYRDGIWNSMSADELHTRIENSDWIFEDHILNLMKEGDTVEIDYDTKTFIITSKTNNEKETTE